MKLIYTELALMAILVLLTIVSPSAGFAVDRMILKEEVLPGQKLNYEINVSSSDDEPIQNMSAEIHGWALNEDGINIELSSENDPRDFTARSFLTAEPHNFVLEPGKVHKLLLTGTVPDNISPGGKYALLTVKTVPMSAEGNQIMVSTAYQILIMLTIKGNDLIKTGEITDFSASLINETIAVGLLFKNTGNIHYKPLVEAILKGESGKILAKFGPELTTTGSILPTNLRRYNISLEPDRSLSSGKYTVEGKVTLEDGTLLDSKTTELKIP